MNTSLNVARWLLAAAVTVGMATALSAAEPAAQTVLSQEALAAWLTSYGEAWETRSADKAVTLFSADATYQDDPYQAPHLGHAGIHKYWSGVTENQRNVKFASKILGVSGATGFAQWTAEFDVEPSKSHILLNGVFVLEFDADGKCRSLREWWHLKTDEPAAAK
ncbi:MAG: nuclear transport factor 2 family protein [Gammaproteobacteria bacterium]|nr:nuclear transport factor 2 family protein [Gammaproteobacteria bacterium]